MKSVIFSFVQVRSLLFLSTLLLSLPSYSATSCSMPQNEETKPFHDVTAEGRYVICTATQLFAISQETTHLENNYLLAADIDLLSYYEKGGEPFLLGYGKLGRQAPNYFSGDFDGNGHTIRGFRYLDENSRFVGLFGFTIGAKIHNLTLEDSRVSGNVHVGALVGRAIESEFLNITVRKAAVKGYINTGLLVGSHILLKNLDWHKLVKTQNKTRKPSIKNVTLHGAIQGLSSHAGGVAGLSQLPVENATILPTFYSWGSFHGYVLGWQNEIFEDDQLKNTLKNIRFSATEPTRTSLINFSSTKKFLLSLPTAPFRIGADLNREALDIDKPGVCGAPMSKLKSCFENHSIRTLDKSSIETTKRFLNIEAEKVERPDFFDK